MIYKTFKLNCDGEKRAYKYNLKWKWAVLINMSKIELSLFPKISASFCNFIYCSIGFSVNQARVVLIPNGSLPLTPLCNW